ncbi:hypothetical protein ZYGR_0N06570 [Zygosaccharomyces rouxii]|uniref:ZYRO0D15400p n=2 Tax=Zygosaccharomyces rouxii TaxID=4956 RepID=C5DWJ7_ZYGRC|nr:uncharacterized protein ZYRO0D15400g [Zygosaccharomyces rouxii]KAH9201076.1 Mis12-Mtw1 protein family-domain-containing protein [Zygosaccharomyces rouxii]GAV49250.1 hypothetical protein ZYGR_0N06570 [Zygosaccharomyces rouxii]CAR28166.1 ZYRO0D15400p [Zygosaccharomyces rouxii]
MSLERSSTSSSPPRRRHGLRLETIPLDSKSGQELDSQFEKDDDFKFKRHHRSTGLGQRFDSLQDVKRAKRVENFNSSMAYNGSQSPHLPYMYYYPMAHPAMAPPPMAPPPPPPPQQPITFQSPSASMMPNSSLQPFYQETPQLLPPPNLYPYHFVQQDSPRHSRRRREHRRREEDEPRVIHSPSKDLPEEDFYRHIGDTSFGKSLQIRQLFNWCIIRSLRNKESQPSAPTDGLDANRIALTIVKEFVNDLRNGKISIDWEAEESDGSGDIHNDNDDEDTELKELFAEDGNLRLPKKESKNDRSTMPNVKNIENQKNLADLESKIESIRREIQDWAHVLDSQKIESEWSQIRRVTIPQEQQKEEPLQDDSSTYEDLVQRIDKLKLHTHLLESHADALSEVSNKKIDILSKDFVKVNHSRQINAKGLLKGLSNSLVE